MSIEPMDKIREIAKRGHWSSAVFDNGPRIGPRRIRIQGEFPTEAAAIDRANQVIAEGRPDISTFIHRQTAKPSVCFHLSHDDLDAIGRAVAEGDQQEDT